MRMLAGTLEARAGALLVTAHGGEMPQLPSCRRRVGGEDPRAISAGEDVLRSRL
jgi:hypothetical protein